MEGFRECFHPLSLLFRIITADLVHLKLKRDKKYIIQVHLAGSHIVTQPKVLSQQDHVNDEHDPTSLAFRHNCSGLRLCSDLFGKKLLRCARYSNYDKSNGSFESVQ
jgi:hypothetical protein